MSPRRNPNASRTSTPIDSKPSKTTPSEATPSDATAFEKVSARALQAAEMVLNVGVDGKGTWKGSVEVAEQHLARHHDVEKAIQRLIATHVRLTSSTGFLSGLGGLITLPVAVPTDFAVLWLTQARLAGAIAHLRGYDITSDEVRSVVLISLIGSSATEALSAAGVQIGTKSAVSVIKKVPGRVLIDINKKVGFRLVTRAGTKGVVNLTKLAPIAGGLVGGGINFASTRAVGVWAKRNFPGDSAVDGDVVP